MYAKGVIIKTSTISIRNGSQFSAVYIYVTIGYF